MTPQRKQFILEKIEEAMKKSHGHLVRAEGLFRAYQDASRSEEGDRANAEATFNLAKQHYHELINFKKEVEKTDDLPAQTANPICFVVTDKMEFYFAKQNLPISGITIIGSSSPFGKAILGKKVGENGIKLIE